ncbi:MAG: multiheme c-type cytochrome [Campylobacterota bacterium]|nr:multiheme c-type cytochrome [Campylobacterota bacterium]
MKYLILSACLLVSVSAEINKKWETNKNCEACHTEISKTWETSRHSNSHFSKNDLYKKTLEYMVVKKPTLILDEVKVECAGCHNPRLVKKKMSEEDKILLAMDNDETTKEYDKALNTASVKNGINCIVCHNIDEIHLDKNKGSEGTHSVKFGPQGTMFGPFNDANSPFHKTVRRQHYVDDSPDLCFVCHYSAKNRHGLEIYATGKEYDTAMENAGGEVEGCKSCHMSDKEKGHASNYAHPGETPKERMVRKHRFTSVDNSNILSRYTEVKASSDETKLDIILKNNSPHKIPTGFGLREIVIEVKFLTPDNAEIEEKSMVLGANWKGKDGKLTIPYLATTLASDTRLDGRSSKTYSFDIPKGSKYAKYSIYYKLVGDKMAKEMGVSDPFFLRKYIFTESRVVFDLVKN